MKQSQKKPRVFIASSTEGKKYAKIVAKLLDEKAKVIRWWKKGLFKLNRATIDTLEHLSKECNFGVFILTPDDIIKIRDNNQFKARDNVIFEFGLFFGILGRDRVFVLSPPNDRLVLPSDLSGLTNLIYRSDKEVETNGKQIVRAIARCEQTPSESEFSDVFSLVKKLIGRHGYNNKAEINKYIFPGCAIENRHDNYQLAKQMITRGLKPRTKIYEASNSLNDDDYEKHLLQSIRRACNKQPPPELYRIFSKDYVNKKPNEVPMLSEQFHEASRKGDWAHDCMCDWPFDLIVIKADDDANGLMEALIGINATDTKEGWLAIHTDNPKIVHKLVDYCSSAISGGDPIPPRNDKQ